MKIKKEEIKNKKSLFGLFEVILLICITCILSLGFGYFLGNRAKKETKIKTDEHLQKFITNYNYLLDNYYNDLNKDALIDAAVRGMIESLGDEYSEFMSESESDMFDITLDGEYEGVGITISNDNNGNIIIIDIIEDSPAAKAGMQIGDIIKKVDDQNMENTPTSDLSSYIKNHKEITFSITRNGNDLQIKATREKVTIKSVESKVIEKDNKKIGYIYINIFALNTTEQFTNALNDLEKQKINSLIIDVRNNGGGHLITARQIISSLMDSSKVMYQLQTKKETTKVYSTGKKNKSYPIVLLTNKNSASGAEVLTAALKENIGAISIGTKTYGKGTVQELKSLTTGSEYKITTKKWLTPTGKDINGTGIKPDIEVNLNEKYAQTGQDIDDNQLQAALDYLKNK